MLLKVQSEKQTKKLIPLVKSPAPDPATNEASSVYINTSVEDQASRPIKTVNYEPPVRDYKPVKEIDPIRKFLPLAKSLAKNGASQKNIHNMLRGSGCPKDLAEYLAKKFGKSESERQS